MIIHFLDTSVFCNILNIPEKSDKHEEMMEELRRIIDNRDREQIVLPYATIIETGNHIAHVSDGSIRYRIAKQFCEAIIKTIEGDAPWVYYGSQLEESDLRKICEDFPEAVKTKTGVGDLSIIRAYERYRDETPAIGEIRIWSTDNHLIGYHEKMEIPSRRRR